MCQVGLQMYNSPCILILLKAKPCMCKVLLTSPRTPHTEFEQMQSACSLQWLEICTLSAHGLQIYANIVTNFSQVVHKIQPTTFSQMLRKNAHRYLKVDYIAVF